MNNIFKTIGGEVHEFLTDEVVVVDGFTRNQKQTIDDNLRLYNSKFKKGQVDTEGFRKYFSNIVRNPCDVATKAIKFSSGDIMVNSVQGQSELYSWYLDRDLKAWFKENDFNIFLDKIFYNLPIHGSVVFKKVKGKLEFVDLRNLIVEQTADSLDTASYVIERHNMTPQQLRTYNWGKIEEAIEAWRNTKKPYIRILERYGEISESELRKDGDPNKYVYARFIVYIPESDMNNDWQDLKQGGYILDKTEITREEFPYREIHWEKIPGVWLGVGRVELLRDPQIRTNEITNLRVKNSYFANLNLWQTRDPMFKKNLAHQVANGQVLNVMQEITRVPTEERNLAATNVEKQDWLSNRDEVSLTYDVVRGERLPAGTPLGSAQIALSMVNSYYEGIRANIARTLKRVFYDDIIPEFYKDRDGEHEITLAGEDLDKLRQLHIKIERNKKTLDFIRKNKTIPTVTQLEAMKAGITERFKKTKIVKFPAKFYKKAKLYIDIVISGEARNAAANQANMSVILQTISADPEVLTNPTKRKVFSRLLQAVGINITDIEAEQEETPPQILGGRAGGGVSAPKIPQAPPAGGGQITI